MSGQAGGGVELCREAAEALGRFDGGDVGAEALGKDSSRPADSGAEVEYAFAGLQFGELGEREGRGQTERVELVHGGEVFDAQALGVESRIAQCVADAAGEAGSVVVGRQLCGHARKHRRAARASHQGAPVIFGPSGSRNSARAWMSSF